MSVTANVAYDSAVTYRDMCHALGEGTLGRSFRAFHASDPKLAQFVVNHATLLMRTFNAKGANWTLGAFAHNYTEVVAEMAEPHLPLFVNHFGQNAWMRDAWELWAQTLRSNKKLISN